MQRRIRSKVLKSAQHNVLMLKSACMLLCFKVLREAGLVTSADIANSSEVYTQR